MTTSHIIEKDNVYVSCDPRGGPSIRVVDYKPGTNRVGVVDAATGKHPRSVLASSLHPTAINGLGRPWRTGYRLVKDAT